MRSFRTVASATNLPSIKSVGNSGATVLHCTIVNTALDALLRLGVFHLDRPVTSRPLRSDSYTSILMAIIFKFCRYP